MRVGRLAVVESSRDTIRNQAGGLAKNLRDTHCTDSQQNYLARSPGIRRFEVWRNAAAGEELAKALQEQDNHTERICIRDIRDLLLSDEGLVQNRFRLTTSALSQLCSRITPALVRAVFSLSGLHKSDPDLDEKCYDATMCIRWLNDAARLRFSRLDRCVLIVNHKTRTVDGLVGRKYASLSNLVFWQHIQNDLKGSAQLSDATLYGRRLQLWYRQPRSLLVVRGKSPSGHVTFNDHFHGGHYFNNSETGECSLKSSPAIIRASNGSSAIAGFDVGNRLVHLRGPAFERGFASFVTASQKSLAKLTAVPEQLKALFRSQLKLPTELEQKRKQVAKLAGRLKAKIPVPVVEQVLSSVFWKELEKRGSQQHVNNRTAFDVYAALTQASPTQSPANRECIEQVAYLILVGDFILF